MKTGTQHTQTSIARIVSAWTPEKRARARTVALEGRVKIAGTSLEQRRAAVRSACQILGARDGPRYVSRSMAKLAGLLKDGFTIEQVLAVVRYARTTYDTGERFRPLLNLLHVWSVGQFTALECAMRTTPAYRREYHIGGMEDQSDPMVIAWNADYDRKVKAAGFDKESNTRRYLEAANRTPEEHEAMMVKQRAWLAEQRRLGNL